MKPRQRRAGKVLFVSAIVQRLQKLGESVAAANGSRGD